MHPLLPAGLTAVLFLLFLAGRAAGQQPVDPDRAPAPPAVSLAFFASPPRALPAAFTNLPLRDLRPDGWIRAMLQQDLSEGFVGKLDQLVPRLFDDDLYGAARRKDPTDIPLAGTQVPTGADWVISMQWWNGETQGNWWDGYMRTAFLTGDQAAIAKTGRFVRHILQTQDTDGYIGIYGPAMRYRHPGDNGELWCQTTLFRMLLGYFEFTGDEAVLRAVVRAMDVTMACYGEGAANPFAVKKDFGGVSHGLMLTDVCETLARLTGDAKYTRFAVYLYREFSRHFINPQFADVRYAALVKPDYPFIGHGAHTYEHLRSLLLAWRATGYPELAQAYAAALRKLDHCLLPGGAGFGDEWLAGKDASADSTAAEFCGMLELRNFYASALQKTGDVSYADKAETLTFNDMLGARYVDGHGITYCKTDNCYVLDRHSPKTGFKEEDPRYKYSPTHDDAAVCCNPNYGRDLPYYVSNMWMQAADGFAAVLYGPMTLSTRWQGTAVEIRETTNYPFSDQIDFILTLGRPAEFSLHLRKPSWSKVAKVEAAGATVTEGTGYSVLRKRWQSGDRVRLSLRNEIQVFPAGHEEVALRRGALIFALAIPARTQATRAYQVGGFTDFLVFPTSEAYRILALDAAAKERGYGFTYVNTAGDANPWYEGETCLVGTMLDTRNGNPVGVRLVPMGGTVLRRVTFRTANPPAGTARP
jgi:DUF1680 family protein